MSRVLSGGVGQTLILARRLGSRILRQRATLLLALCVMTGAGASAALGFFSSAVQHALDQDVAVFLGAPLVIRSTRPQHTTTWPSSQDLRTARTASFTTGATGPEHYHSVALKAVSRGYPVQGELLIRTGDQAGPAAGIPARGTAWLDNRAMASLGARAGDIVHIGQSTFNVGAELIFEPDRLTQLQHTLPRVIIAMADLDAIGLDLHNGRGDFRYLFAGPPEALEGLESALVESDVEVLKPQSGAHPLARMSQRASRLLGMVCVLVLVLCGSAAAVLGNFAVRRYAMPAAVLRCLGVERRVVARALALQLELLAIVAGLLGCAIGWALQPLLGRILEPHLTINAARFEFGVAAVAVGIGILTVFAFVLPRLAALNGVPTIAALRGEATWRHRNGLSLLIAAACAVAMLRVYSDNGQLTLILGAGVFGVSVLAAVLGWLLSQLAGQLHRATRGWVRVALRSIGRSAIRHAIPMATIALAVMAFLSTAMLRGSFLDAYHDQRYTHDGNYLFTRLAATNIDTFRSIVAENGANVAGVYPAVRAHLVAINGIAIDDALSRESDTREETRSPVLLSWSETVPDNNVLKEGEWPAPGSDGVSVDSEVMSDLGLEIGDSLEFRIGDESLPVRITSRRGFIGGGSSVTFWFMVAPDALEGLDQEYLGGLRIDADSRSTLAALSSAFPDLVITDLEQHLSRIRSIMAAITRVMNSLMLLLLGAASMVILAIAVAGSDQGRKQGAILRAMGASQAQLRGMLVMEYGTVGLSAAVVGVLGAQAIADLMFRYQFSMPYEIDWIRYALIPIGTAVGFVALGLGSSRAQLRQSPVRILQQA